MKRFLKQNLIFVLLLSIILCVTLGFGVYYVIGQKPDIIEEKEKPVEPSSQVKPETAITYMSADFKSGNTIRVSWEITEGEKRVSAIELYCNENKLADVDSSNYFEMPLGVYQFFGNVPFTLKVTLEDGTQLEKQVKIQIPKVLSPKQEVKLLDDGVEVRFTYKYYEKDQIDVPKVYLMNVGTVDWNVEFISNEVIGNEGVYVSAVATYHIRAKDLADGMYGFDVRYVFESVSQSFNDRVEFEMKQPVDDGEVEEPQAPQE